LSYQAAKARRICCAAAKCSNQTDLHLTFIDPIQPAGLRQRPSLTFVPLATDQRAENPAQVPSPHPAARGIGPCHAATTRERNPKEQGEELHTGDVIGHDNRVNDLRIPQYHELMWPALQATKELGGSATVREMNERAMASAGISEEQQGVPHGEDGRMSEGGYRLH
jgi:hypothetical protein